MKIINDDSSNDDENDTIIDFQLNNQNNSANSLLTTNSNQSILTFDSANDSSKIVKRKYNKRKTIRQNSDQIIEIDNSIYENEFISDTEITTTREKQTNEIGRPTKRKYTKRKNKILQDEDNNKEESSELIINEEDDIIANESVITNQGNKSNNNSLVSKRKYTKRKNLKDNNKINLDDISDDFINQDKDKSSDSDDEIIVKPLKRKYNKRNSMKLTDSSNNNGDESNYNISVESNQNDENFVEPVQANSITKSTKHKYTSRNTANRSLDDDEFDPNVNIDESNKSESEESIHSIVNFVITKPKRNYTKRKSVETRVESKETTTNLQNIDEKQLDNDNNDITIQSDIHIEKPIKRKYKKRKNKENEDDDDIDMPSSIVNKKPSKKDEIEKLSNGIPFSYIKSNKYYNINQKKINISKYLTIRNRWMNDHMYKQTVDRFNQRTSKILKDNVENIEISTLFTTLHEWIDVINSDASDSKDCIVIPNVYMHVNINDNVSIQIAPYTSFNIWNEDNDIDIFINACGSIWSSSFAPYRGNCNQYLAVGLSSIGWNSKLIDNNNRYKVGIEKPYFMNEIYTNPNILQVWSTNSVDSIDRFQLDYCIGFTSSGPLWQCEWCPNRFDNELSIPLDSQLDRTVVGLVSIILGNGSCNIIPIVSYKSDYNDSSTIPVIDIINLPKFIIKLSHNVITSTNWNPHNHSQICCGVDDGSICIYNVSLFDLVGIENNERTISPYIRLYDRSIDYSYSVYSIIKAVEYCPYDDKLIASVGFDGMMKVWNVDKSNKPIYSKRTTGSGWLYDVKWDPFGKGLYFGASDNTNVIRNYLWNTEDYRVILYQHNSRHCGVWKLNILVEDNQSMISSVSSDGTVRCGLISLLTKTKPVVGIDRFVYQCFQIKEVMDVNEDDDLNFQHVQINVSVDETFPSDNKSNDTLPKSNAIAIQSLSSLSTDKNNLLCYGGAVGLLRIHNISLVETFVDLR